jgi:MFS family permease
MALNAIYATMVIGLSAVQLGIGLAVAAGIRLVLSVPLGHLADRIGPRTVQIWSFVALVPLTAALLVVHGFGQYVVVVSVQAVAWGANRGANMAMVAGVIPAAERVRVRGYLRATTNASIAVGAAVAGMTLAIGTPTAYRSALIANVLTYAVAAVLTTRLPAVAPQPARRGPRMEALRDRPFLVFVALDGIMSMHYQLLDVVIPLWIVQRTNAPHWMVAVILVTNTVAVVLLQVRATRGTDEITAAARAVRLGGLCIAAACAIFALSGTTAVLVTGALLFAGALAHVLGEVRQAAGSWGISFGLAPEHAQGQYQGAYAMGMDLGKMVAPAVLIWLVLGYGVVGWLIMAAVFAIAGLFMPAVIAWARRQKMTLASPAT